jgi:hypothetical protein
MAFDFLDTLNDSATKQKFQKYNVKIGIESFTVLVPFEKSNIFETQLTEAISNQETKFKMSTLQHLVNEVNGQVKVN